ncbi:DoxX family protein [Actinocorallia sp. A-T 12471]|uniref:DoxX family protein n=1 Tax=Actinocorallia sp. A-T 12471 TaxID=3089813 RepID=UPI0029CC8417|nr:DoxX family protein [Actinocorallia sp. A-T 12471]MDX6743423.1 DoxX family protein [Actinocorallia sp. A-T 12471]
MDIAVWIVTGIVALILGGAGASKLVQTKEKILENPKMGWANDFSQPAIRLIGLAEVAGALGLVLPWAFDVLPVLTPIAGYCLAALMVGAAVVHIRRKEYDGLPVVFLLVAAPLFVAVARTVAL